MALIIIPAYNEAKKIGRVLRDLFEHGFKDVVVVDDGSGDVTGEIAASEGAVVLRHALNRGQGAALETGNEYARRQGFDTVVHFDADNQHDAGDIAPALEFLKVGNLDAVLGSRFMRANRLPVSKRLLILPLARLINFLFAGVKLTDGQNGFRIFGAAALQKIRIEQPRMAHNSEIVGSLKRNNLKFAEVPVTVYYHEYGQGMISGFRVVVDLVKSLFV
ncbi:MAG: glycosyltransferase family 2 protein [Candidatus Magasanikbacteria bacterium]|nr:glycosyltransferase family 2 protein [Candidatus Magasanikbacteria bacterium]